MFVSDYFQLSDEQYDQMLALGLFDAILDKDSNFYINIIRLKQSTVPEFQEAYRHLNRFFSEIATLLDCAETPSLRDKFYRTARKRFQFHEVNEICLGHAESRYGAGWGQITSDKFLYDAYQIVKKGSKQPEIFHLVSLFEDNVAGDRLSDMIATIIKPEIKKYTIRMQHELGITAKAYPHLTFYKNGLIKNPIKTIPILLLPEEILHKLPIAKNWDDIDSVISENELIRREISAEIGTEWSRWASAAKKDYLKQHIFMQPQACKRVVTGYKKEKLSLLDLKENDKYLAELILKRVKKALSFQLKETNTVPSSFDAAMDVISIFKDWVENNRGWALIQDSPANKREKAVQRFIHLGAKHYIAVNNLDLSCEADEGRGPVDLKLSRGNDKTLAEIKLSSNGQYLHGYETQVQEYGAADQTRNLIYVFVDVGNPGRLETLKNLHRKNLLEGKKCPELVIIDARKKNSASTYNSDKAVVADNSTVLDNMSDIDSMMKDMLDVDALLKDMSDVDTMLKDLPDANTLLKDMSDIDTMLKDLPDADTLLKDMSDIDTMLKELPDADTLLKDNRYLNS